MKLIDKIKDKSAKIGVIGLGYVGLPLAVEKAKAGYEVLGFDVQAEKVEKVNKGINYIGDVVNEELEDIVKNKRLSATTNYDKIAECDAVMICVPTPLDKYKQPDLTYVEASTKEVAKRIHSETLVVLESTTYPGTTEEIMLPILESSGLKAGVDFYLAYSPERVDPGNITYKTKNTPKVVGGVTEKCTKVAQALYESVLDAKVFTVSSPKEAEMSKILENSFRIVNIAFINEMAIVAKKMGINIWEVVDAASTKPFGFMPFYPGPGVGGHCIPIDPFYLTYKARAYDYHTRLIEMAGEINDSMPDYVVEQLTNIMNDNKKCLNGAKILLMGVAYKNDIEDMRESPALKVIERLESKKANVVCSDPYVETFKINGKEYKTEKLTPELVESADAVIITTGHKNNVDYDMLVEKAKVILDTKNTLKDKHHENKDKIFLI